RPKLRVDGDIVNATTEEVLTPKDTLSLAYSVLTENQKKRFETENELDFSFGIQNLARFRGNCFKQRGCVSVVIRQIPFTVKTFDDLGLPPVIAQRADRLRGLVLVTGTTGSGKSSTLAEMIDKINKEMKGHIITVEDPIEFIHRHQSCIVNQREIGTDTQSFAAALKYALRQDPDVVLVGEMRDLETIQAALTIAETGHLAFATLHTNSAMESINRIIDVFPSHQQSQVRAQLAFVLEGVVTQTLLQRGMGKGRRPRSRRAADGRRKELTDAGLPVHRAHAERRSPVGRSRSPDAGRRHCPPAEEPHGRGAGARRAQSLQAQLQVRRRHQDPRSR